MLIHVHEGNRKTRRCVKGIRYGIRNSIGKVMVKVLETGEIKCM